MHQGTRGETTDAQRSTQAPAPSKVTVADVARRAGVSVGTVSNVLNGRASVSETRRTEVLSAIRDLGFTQNLLAKGMRLQRSNVVGLCMPYSGYSNFSALVDEIEQCLSDSNYQMMQVLSRQDPDKEFSRVERLVAYKIGGLMLVPSLKPKAILDFLHQRGVPTVLVNRTVVEDRRFDQVAVDHRTVMFRLTGELIARRYAQRDPRRAVPGAERHAAAHQGDDRGGERRAAPPSACSNAARSARPSCPGSRRR